MENKMRDINFLVTEGHSGKNFCQVFAAVPLSHQKNVTGACPLSLIVSKDGNVHDAFLVYDPAGGRDDSVLYVSYDWLCDTLDAMLGRLSVYSNNGTEIDGTSELNIDPNNRRYNTENFVWHGICLLKKGNYTQTISAN
jgi:hypothetical protein